MEAVLIVLGLAATVTGGWWVVAKLLAERRRRRDDDALAEVLRLREQGVLETEMPDELLERAERAQRRLREAGR